MRDILETLEAAGEAAMERATEGVPEGMWRCGCGKVTTMDDAHPVSANPYAMPVCGDCLERAEIESTLNRMQHLGFTDWAFKRGAFFSEVQARGEGIFNVLAIESARMIIEHGVLLAERAAFENEVAIDNEIISRLTAQVAELEKERKEKANA